MAAADDPASGPAVRYDIWSSVRKARTVRRPGRELLIGVDWGTSNFRAFRLDDRGEVIETRTSPDGVLRIPEGGFAAALRRQIGDWLEAGESRVLLCGMVGSRQGWQEANYLPVPVGPADLAGSVTRVRFDEAEVLLIPGVRGTDSSGVPEVMRGEETQIVGAWNDLGGNGLLCLPGTHSKWVHCSGNTILSFTTSMTGEVFAALCDSTILGRLMAERTVQENKAFLRGVARSAEVGGLLHHLFGARTLPLTHQLEAEETASYLSGLLIGSEIRGTMPDRAHVHLVGASHLCALYSRAIQACGGSATHSEEHATARGLASIGRRLSWI